MINVPVYTFVSFFKGSIKQFVIKKYIDICCKTLLISKGGNYADTYRFNYSFTRDGFENLDDGGWEKPSEIVFIEAVDEYEKNDSLDSFAEKIRKMTKE